MPKSWEVIIVVLLLGFFIWECVSSLLLKSVTIDEFANLPLGYYNLKTGDLSLDPQAPPLSRLFFALPLLARNPEMNLTHRWLTHWDLARDFMYKNAAGYQRMFTACRLLAVPGGMLLCLLVWLWSRELGGRGAGLLALFLCVFEPNVIAHSRLITFDIPAALFFTLSLYLFWKFCISGKPGWLFATGFILGLSQLVKFTSLLLYPLIFFIGLIILLRAKEEGVRYRLADRNFPYLVVSYAILLLVSLLVINTGYFFRDVFFRLEEIGPRSSLVRSYAGSFWGKVPLPLPKAFLVGIDRHLYEGERGVFPAYLLGKISFEGFRHYYLVALAVKTPLAIFCLLAAVLLARKGPESRALLRDGLLFLVFPAIAVFLFFSFLNKNLGFRYLLPAVSLLLIFIGSLTGRLWTERGRWFKASVILLLIWLPVSSLGIHPHYLAYFNELAGGADNGSRVLIDSNLDWGQDLICLRDYLNENKIGQIYFAYFGMADPRIYGVNFIPLQEKPDQGWVAISASLVRGRPFYSFDRGYNPVWRETDYYAWARELKPAAKVGHSIFLYDLGTGNDE